MTDLHERGRALEEHFFAEHDRELIAKAKAAQAESEQMEALSQVTGIRDPELLRSVIAAGASAESAAALSLTPLIIVAWADGQVQELEREAILDAAKESGVTDAAAQNLISKWLGSRPSPEMIEAWEKASAELISALQPADRQKLASQIMDNARKVAASAGGVIGFGKTSSDEKAALDRLEAALS